ncbi:MAG: succinate dehydrogenase, hydrophobic membrane anchor protein [Pseudomonadota bacterium]|nr:succinate dehydrogenase, hydrophobic membrane anchor protein [Pseudomonadota bacterium]
MTRSFSPKSIKGFGPAKGGVHHWKMQRLTAIALVPLCVWLSVSISLLASAEYETIIQWVAKPAVTTLLLLTIPALFFHLKLGLQIIIEDYVRSGQLRSLCLMGNVFVAFILTIIAVTAVLRIAL